MGGLKVIMPINHLECFSGKYVLNKLQLLLLLIITFAAHCAPTLRQQVCLVLMWILETQAQSCGISWDYQK